MLRAVILDVDGTLVDSNDAHAQAWVQALQEHGHQASLASVRSLIGMGADHLLPRAAGMMADSPEGKAIAKRRGEIFKSRHLPGIRPFPGTRDLLLRIRAQGLALGVASSAQEDELQPLLKIAGAHDLIQSATSSDDADHSKPDPDIVKAALWRLRCAGSEAVMLGDTPYDIEAAGRSGVRCIALRCGGWDERALRSAVEIHDGPADLLASFSRSLLGRPAEG